MNLGHIVKKCRKLRGLTQSQLSILANISESHLSLIEKNKREPSLSTLESIANSLKIPVSILIFLASQNEEITELTNTQIETLTSSIYALLEK